jgi:ribosomal protein L29
MIEEINQLLFLPHIQRPFVWDEEQMRRLFDSLMRNYPIQTFLFWRTKEPIKVRRFMETIEWDPTLSRYYNSNKSLADVEKVFVLDGQQRLQTLYALFAGTVLDAAGTTKREAFADATAGESPDQDGIMFPSVFDVQPPGPQWYRLRDLTTKHDKMNSEEIADQLNENLGQLLPLESSETTKSREKRVRRNIAQLVNLLRLEGHFWVEELDGVASSYPYRAVLDIFVRVNSGGTKLSAADLMFAIMKEEWSDIEERVEEVVATLNDGRLAFDKDFVLKCLVLANGHGAELTPEKFNSPKSQDLLAAVENNWSIAEQAFLELRDFIKNEIRIVSDSLVRSYMAFVPLFDFLFYNPKPDEANRHLMRAYYYKSQLFNWYRAHTDSLLNVIHRFVGKPLNGKFPIKEIKEYFHGNGQSTSLKREHLSEGRLRFILLNLVYVETFGTSPFDVKFKGNAPHVDHIYPQYGLRNDLLLSGSEINHLGNYRFVGATDNIRKRAEKPASYFSRLRCAGIDIRRHLLLDDVSANPSLLLWDASSYGSFRDRRLDAIFEIVSRVVNAERLPTATTAATKPQA